MALSSSFRTSTPTGSSGCTARTGREDVHQGKLALAGQVAPGHFHVGLCVLDPAPVTDLDATDQCRGVAHHLLRPTPGAGEVPRVEHDAEIVPADRADEVERTGEVGDAGVGQELDQDGESPARRALRHTAEHVGHLVERHRVPFEVDHVHRFGPQALGHVVAALFADAARRPGERAGEAVDVTHGHAGVLTLSAELAQFHA